MNDAPDIPRVAAPSVEADLIRAGELASLLNVSVRTVWRLQSGGSIPQPIRLGGVVRWRREEVRDWISRGCPNPRD